MCLFMCRSLQATQVQAQEVQEQAQGLGHEVQEAQGEPQPVMDAPKHWDCDTKQCTMPKGRKAAFTLLTSTLYPCPC